METENIPEQLINGAGVLIKVPTINSRGKIKQLKCKRCDFVAATKREFWQHSRIHISEDKQLRCPECEFVTEFKQHFVYHMRNHTGCKPFKCSQCSYSSVNKAMLNSHLKNHSKVYPYSCADCMYVTKYLQSLKAHLRKHSHKPGVARNLDGTPNPLLVINVHGTRRGPKVQFEERGAVQESSLQAEPSRSISFEEELTTVFDCVEVIYYFPEETSISEESSSGREEYPRKNDKDENCCKFCKINFRDPILYSMHMDFHNVQNPFTCNKCGEEYTDKFTFFAHIALAAHFDKID